MSEIPVAPGVQITEDQMRALLRSQQRIQPSEEEMADTPERKLKKKITDLLKECKIYYTYTVSGGYARNGVPDLLACVNGMFVAIEVKSGSNKPTALQEMHLAEIARCGGETFVVNEDNYWEFEQWVRVRG